MYKEYGNGHIEHILRSQFSHRLCSYISEAITNLLAFCY